MLKIKIKKNITFLYCFLFAGAFNDILRIGITEVTLFRIMMPFAAMITLLYSKKVRRIYKISLGIAIISLIQSFVFSRINDAGVQFDISRYMTYLVLYMCIVTVIGAIIVICEMDSDFVNNFESYLLVVGICYLLVFMFIYHGNYDYDYVKRGYILNNVNDYGSMLAAIVPVFYYRAKKQKNVLYLLFILITFLYLIFNDSKLALLGTLVQAVIIIYFETRNKLIGYRKVIFIPAISLVALLIFIISQQNFSLNGYDWRGTVVEPVKAIIRGNMYGSSNSSVSYRVNSFILSTQWMVKTKMMGIGIGNSGVLIRNLLGGHSLYESWMQGNSISLHNSILEILLEFGFVAIIGLVFLIRYIMRILRNTRLNMIQMCFITVAISALLWLQGPSGILTDYQIFAVFTFLIVSTSDRMSTSSEGTLKLDKGKFRSS